MGTLTGRTPGERARLLAADLWERGKLADPRWEQALVAVPRHLFVPHTGWAVPDTPGAAPGRIDATADPDGWWDAVYSDTSIVIQADDGAGDPASGEGLSSSSVSAPGVVAQFLELLDVRDDSKVLEIGTGSGWTAALLCHMCGEERVTSAEVDPALAARAAAAIRAAGYSPRLITGDGAAGDPAGGPFDRVHVTCAVTGIPQAWIAQVRPGGVIVLPWAPSGPTGYRLRLTVTGDTTATGSVHGRATYMMLRAQRQPGVWNSHHASEADTTATRLDPRQITEAGTGGHLAITAQVPGAGWHTIRDADGSVSLLLYEAADPDGSWAACDYTPGAAEFPVTQYGQRRLWDETAAAYLAWLRYGSPQAGRYGLTVSDDGIRIWVDSPSNVIAVPLPGQRHGWPGGDYGEGTVAEDGHRPGHP